MAVFLRNRIRNVADRVAVRRSAEVRDAIGVLRCCGCGTPEERGLCIQIPVEGVLKMFEQVAAWRVIPDAHDLRSDAEVAQELGNLMGADRAAFIPCGPRPMLEGDKPLYEHLSGKAGWAPFFDEDR